MFLNKFIDLVERSLYSSVFHRYRVDIFYTVVEWRLSL